MPKKCVRATIARFSLLGLLVTIRNILESYWFTVTEFDFLSVEDTRNIITSSNKNRSAKRTCVAYHVTGARLSWTNDKYDRAIRWLHALCKPHKKCCSLKPIPLLLLSAFADTLLPTMLESWLRTEKTHWHF